MGLLGDLAGMALGERPAGAARVVLPPRFAPRSTPLEAGEIASLETPIQDETPTRPAAAPPTAARSAIEESTTIQPVTRPVEHRGSEQRTVPDLGHPPPPLEPLVAERVQIAASVQATMSHARTMHRHDGPTGSKALPSAPITLPAISAPATSKQGPGPVPFAPLSAPAVASRAQSPADPAPTVINITIDRIDVRASAPSRPATAPAARPRPQPSVSLADYLAGQGRRG